jgi:ADP-ribose pyrophosphatase YjhB (NUDIX family)
MKRLKENYDIQQFLEKGNEIFLPNISVDCVIFGFHENQLKVLLLKWKDLQQWCLPGGFIYTDEHVDDSAKRILLERTGLKDIFLKQFYTFGNADRERFNVGKSPVKVKKGSWILNRFITIGYWALVEFSKVKPMPDFLSDSCKWWDVNRLPKLMLDHSGIIRKALESLQFNLNDYPVGHNLLPSKFTMPELQQLYETILNKKLDRRNFQKKIIALDILERLPERKLGGAHKAPYYYRFDRKKYQKAMKRGLKFGV